MFDGIGEYRHGSWGIISCCLPVRSRGHFEDARLGWVVGRRDWWCLHHPLNWCFPSEVGTSSTLCGAEGRVAAIVFIAVAIVWSSLLFAAVGRRLIDVTSFLCTLMA